MERTKRTGMEGRGEGGREGEEKDRNGGKGEGGGKEGGGGLHTVGRQSTELE